MENLLVSSLRETCVPFPFHYNMEGFDSMMRVATKNSLLQGFKVGSFSRVDMQIYHLLYADDNIIFCGVEEQIRTVRRILVVFEVVSGLAVNWRKNCIYPNKEVTRPAPQNVC